MTLLLCGLESLLFYEVRFHNDSNNKDDGDDNDSFIDHIRCENTYNLSFYPCNNSVKSVIILMLQIRKQAREACLSHEGVAGTNIVGDPI